MIELLSPFMRELIDLLEKNDIDVTAFSGLRHIIPKHAELSGLAVGFGLPCRYENGEISLYYRTELDEDEHPILPLEVPEGIDELLQKHGYMRGEIKPLSSAAPDSSLKLSYKKAVSTPLEALAEFQWIIPRARKIWPHLEWKPDHE